MAGRRAITRRRFLGRAATAGGLVASPCVVPGMALGADGRAAPNDRIGVGMIGVGRQTYHYNIKAFLTSPDTQVVAVSDVDAWRMDDARPKKSVEDSVGAWVLKPHGNGRTIVAYTVAVDTGMSVPKIIQNWLTNKSLKKVVKAVKKKVEGK